MNILVVICIGFLVGLVAELLLPGRSPSGFLLTSLLGIGGAMLSSYLGHVMGWYGDQQLPGFIGAVIGSMLLLAVYRILKDKPSGNS